MKREGKGRTYRKGKKKEGNEREAIEKGGKWGEERRGRGREKMGRE